MPDRHLLDATADAPPTDEQIQELVEAERGMGTQGVRRRWLASDSASVVLTSDATGVKISRDNGTTPPAQVIVDGTTAGGSLMGTYPNPTISPSGMDEVVPPGTIWPYAGTGLPVGWLLCDGVARATTAYPKLYAAIGTTYNIGGDAAGTFRTPNLVGRVVLGVSGPHPLGQQGGAETGGAHTHPGSHAHGMNSHTHGPGLHQHLEGAHTHAAGTHQHEIPGHAHGVTSHVHGLADHRHDIGHDHANATAAASASGTGTNSIQNGTGSATTVPASNHTHDVNLPAYPATNSGVPSATDTSGITVPVNTSTAPADVTGAPSAATGGVNGTVSVGAPSPAHVTDAATGSTATDPTAHPASYADATVNLPPFLAVAYIIRAGV